ncbi:MAG: hypothetical protein ACYDCI_13960 [Candidatus Limnocylindrales bacterium]
MLHRIVPSSPRAWIVTLGHATLACWFAYQLMVAQNPPWGVFGDALLYHNAAASWIAGGDPWQVATRSSFHFAGAPPTVLLFAPFAALDGRVFAVAFGLVSIFAGYVIVRELRLPLYWLIFPPLVEGENAANPHIVLLAVLLTTGRPIAALLKVYAVIPLIGERRWRSLCAVAALTAISVVLWPGLWGTYIVEFGRVSARLMVESSGGFSATGLAIVPAVAALAVIARRDLRTAGWLAVPAVWPGSQFFYTTMAMPVMRPWLAVAAAIRMQGLFPVLVVAMAVIEVGARTTWLPDPIRRAFILLGPVPPSSSVEVRSHLRA